MVHATSSTGRRGTSGELVQPLMIRPVFRLGSADNSRSRSSLADGHRIRRMARPSADAPTRPTLRRIPRRQQSLIADRGRAHPARDRPPASAAPHPPELARRRSSSAWPSWAPAFLLAWGAEALQLDISQGLALALLALIAVLPEYAVDFVFTWKAGEDPDEFAPLALANMTGGNRLLIGIGWSMVVLLAAWRITRIAARAGLHGRGRHRRPPRPAARHRDRVPRPRDALLADAAAQEHAHALRRGGPRRRSSPSTSSGSAARRPRSRTSSARPSSSARCRPTSAAWWSGRCSCSRPR